jgi:hypothetical protein
MNNEKNTQWNEGRATYIELEEVGVARRRHLLELVFHGATHREMRATAAACKSDHRSNISSAEAQNTPVTQHAWQLPPHGAGRRGLSSKPRVSTHRETSTQVKNRSNPRKLDRTNLFTARCGGAHGWLGSLDGHGRRFLNRVGPPPPLPALRYTGPTMVSRARGGGGKRRRWGGTFYWMWRGGDATHAGRRRHVRCFGAVREKNGTEQSVTRLGMT